jgi:hypothetical protein
VILTNFCDALVQALSTEYLQVTESDKGPIWERQGDMLLAYIVDMSLFGAVTRSSSLSWMGHFSNFRTTAKKRLKQA